ncbi:MAG TPA: hypothetical protein VFN07_03315 [Trueperaceae bacterium]|nr:hypothetical protein [Trueperaceae bacterium]
MKRIVRIFIVVAGMAVLLSACQEPPPAYSFEGITTSSGVELPLALSFERRGERLTGEYRVLNAVGVFSGVISGEVIIADLRPSSDCSYDFEGALVGDSLTGAFTPTACPGGQAGVWALVLR